MMTFSKPSNLEYPSNRNFRIAGRIHRTNAEEIARFMKEEVLFLNYINDAKKKAK